MERLAGPLAAGGRLQLGGGGGSAFVRLIPGGGGLLLLHTDPRAALERINAQLQALDEEVGAAGVAGERMRAGARLHCGFKPQVYWNTEAADGTLFGGTRRQY